MYILQTINLHRALVAGIFAFLLLTPYCILPSSHALAGENVSAGIANEPMWFSKEPFFAGEKITVFTLIYNSSAYKMTGTIELRDGTTTIDTKAFVVNGDGAAKVIGFAWTASTGSHAFRVVISSKQFLDDEGREQSSAVANAATSTDETRRIIDVDTDGDMVGNMVDDDDDGDGLLDTAEKKMKLDPLNPDTDGDGLPDGTDKEPLRPAPIIPLPPQPTTTPTSSILPSVEQQIKDNLPEPVANKAIPVVGALESFRVGQAVQYLEWIEKIQDELDARTATTSEATGVEPSLEKKSGWKTLATGIASPQAFINPFGYVKLFFVLVIQFLVSNPYVFYILLLLFMYKIIRTTLNFFF